MKGSVIHVVENLDKGAVENWLVNVFLESRKHYPDLKWTFFCILGKEGRLDEEVRRAGGEIIYSPYWISEKIKFLAYFRKVLKNGSYDILHVHHDYLSGFYLLASIGIKFRKRLLHIHNTDKWLPIGNAFARKLMLGPCRYAGTRLSDKIIGISRDTLDQFIQGASVDKTKTEVLYYGIDLHRFYTNGIDIRRELRLPENSKILLFAGRMNEFKNPAFVVDILNVLVETRDDVYAIFVGKGGEEESVMLKARQYKIEDRIRLMGWRSDIPNIMKSADVFVFPRVENPKEGLGLVVVEAQAAGLPMILSYGIVEDAIVIPELASYLSLDKGWRVWANKINEVLCSGKPVAATEALNRMEVSCFSLPVATKNLVSLYS